MNLTYELFENGYFILLDGQRWIAQGGEYGNYFPNRVVNKDGSVNLEESAKAHIQAIIDENAKASEEKSQLDRIESGTTQLLADIKAEAIDDFTLELMEGGLL